MERRILRVHEVRAQKSGKDMRISGYAARYNVLANLGNFLERIATRVFDRILGTDPDVVALFNHDANNILGRTSAGTKYAGTNYSDANFEECKAG